MNVQRRSIGFSVSPQAGVVRLTDTGHWQVASLPARLALQADGGEWPRGWVLIKATLRATGWDRTARLYADNGVPEGGVPVFDLPLSAKGILIELIKLPQATRTLLLQPMDSLGEFTLAGLEICPVGLFERTARMVVRVVATRYVHPRRRLTSLGLRWSTMFLDLPRAYRLAGSLRAYAPAPGYTEWLKRHDRLTGRDLRRIARGVARGHGGIDWEVSVLSGPEPDEGAYQRTMASISAQLMPPARVSRVGWGQEMPEASVAQHGARPRWCLFLPEGAALSPHALYWLARVIAACPEAGFAYCDHDLLSLRGERVDPTFKPDWSPELLRSSNYIGPAAAVRADVLAAAGGMSDAAEDAASRTDLHDLWLRITERLSGDQIRHLCAPLIHVPTTLDRRFLDDSPRAVARHLRRLNVDAEVESDRLGHCRVRYALTKPRPLVSIIVPTRDRLELLRPCLESVLDKTTYREYELLVVDNLSGDPATLAYLEQVARNGRVRVLRYAHLFNFSAINNFAVSEARGELVCLLNNDTEVITPDWLEEMLGPLVQPGVGAVGAKLLFADGRVQHGGDAVGPGGCANHLHHLLPGDAPGYMHRAVLAQDLSAVTGACLLTRRALYLSLGGLNERDLPVAFNDVDYCLRLRAAGWRVVWTPHARLYHYESVSRGRDASPEQLARAKREVAYMTRRWGQVMRHDPFYNPNLSYARPDFSLSRTPMVDRPGA